MFIILIYDIDDENSNNIKILNICRQYLFHIQNSCFHGYITHKNLNELIKKLNKNITSKDHIILYQLTTDKYLKVKEYGKEKVNFQTIIQ